MISFRPRPGPGTLAGLAAGLCLAATAALAGDYADRQILGFSADGRYFAFEEFGVQDGSGFPYSNTYVIDTDSDRWAGGTPVRVLTHDENVPLDDARAEAHGKAAPVLARYGIGAPGQIVVSNPSTELSTDPYVVRFLTGLYANYGESHAWKLTLTLLPFPDRPPCENLGPVNGFRLVLESPGGGDLQTLNLDESVPASRGCPQDYAIADVVTYFPEGRAPVMAVLVHMISQGFEGPDRRFLAVTTRFTDR